MHGRVSIRRVLSAKCISQAALSFGLEHRRHSVAHKFAVNNDPHVAPHSFSLARVYTATQDHSQSSR